MKNLFTVISLSIVAFFLQSCGKEKVNTTSRTLSSGDIQTIAGLGPTDSGYSGDGGPANLAKVSWVTGIAVDQSNNIYFTDGATNTVRMICSNSKVIYTVAGIPYPSTDIHPYFGDGGLAKTAHLNIPLSIALDGSGNMAIADAGNNVIRFVSASNENISTIAGKGPAFQGYNGDGASATLAYMWNPYSVAFDPTGNIYFADSENNVVRLVTKSTGIITTIAGLGPDHPGYSGDNGSAKAAQLNQPTGVALDADGNIYIADNGNHVIRKISNDIISTIAGSGGVGYSGDGVLATQAKLSASIVGITTDGSGNIYFADSGNNVVRKITVSTGIISTVAGSGDPGYSGDGGPALQAKLSGPLGVAVDSEGNLYIADSQNASIRIVIK